MLPPPESSKSRHSKQLKPPEDLAITTAIESNSVDNSNKSKTKTLKDDNWLNSSSALKIEDANQTNNNETKNGLNDGSTLDDNSMNEDSILQQANITNLTSAQYIDAFSDLDPLGTGKFRPYIDKKYFFQDLKNPPKKVLKDLSDRDGGFPANFKPNLDFANFQDKSSFDTSSNQQNASDTQKSTDNNDEFVTQFTNDTQIFSPNNNGTHGTPPNSTRTTNDMFTATFRATTQNSSFACIEEINTNSNQNKTDDQIIGNNRALLVTDNDPFSPRMKKFDLFEDDFSKKSINAFDFNFTKGTKSTLLPDTRIVNEDKPKYLSDKKSVDDGVYNGSIQVSFTIMYTSIKFEKGNVTEEKI